MRYIVAAIKIYNFLNFYELQKKYTEHEFLLVKNKEELVDALNSKFSPDYIFFPHWSWIIPKEIYDSFNCVVFHMTDLPFGRGGSPLQNLLVRGIYNTKISAIKVQEGLDTGDIYMKEDFVIDKGNADEILKAASDIVFKQMIPKFIENQLSAVPQQGNVVNFKRRTPDQSEIPGGLNKRELYDYIRMLDGEGYPVAYIQDKNKKIYFRNAQLTGDKLIAEVEIEVNSDE